MPSATQQEIKWKIGDKVFHDHEEKTITKIEDGRVTGLATQYIHEGFNNVNDEIFPVTEGGRKIVDFFHEQYMALHKIPGNRLFNWPDLAYAIEDRFLQTMRCYHSGDESGVIGHLYRAGKFFEEVQVWAAKATAVTVGGFRLFNSNQ